MKNNELKKGINRREFIVRSAATAITASLAPGALPAQGKFHPFPESILPTRPLGNTGASVPLLTFGAAGGWIQNDDDTALKMLSLAIDSGLTSIDTAYNYGAGRAERLIGALMPRRRKEVLLHTKISTRDKNQWWAHLETSLNRMKIEYVDTLMIHHLEDDDDLAALEVDGGPLELLNKAKEQKLARWIGVSCHANPFTLVKLIRRHKLDLAIVSVNAAIGTLYDLGFEQAALPEANARGLGIIAMKIMGAGKIVDKHPELDYATCMRYSLSLPVASATITMPNFQYLSKNLEVARNFEPLSAGRMKELREKAAGAIRTSFLEFMKGHNDLV